MEEKQLPRAMMILGLLLALGMSGAAFILGVQARHAVPRQQSITVKGLAEKPARADNAEWTVRISTRGATIAEAVEKLRGERPVLDEFLLKRGLEKSGWDIGNESVSPHYEEEPLENGGTRSVQRGYDAEQAIRIATRDLDKITTAHRELLQLRMENHPVSASAPLYLVGNLEEIKMSLIADATRNARTRAQEFVKQDGVKVGVMRQASQGAFYILAVGGEASDDSYGGVYDKTTIDKIARVVVTIVYNIEP